MATDDDDDDDDDDDGDDDDGDDDDDTKVPVERTTTRGGPTQETGSEWKTASESGPSTREASPEAANSES